MFRSREPWDEAKSPVRSNAVRIQTEAATSQEDSTLLALPAEIRNLIFEYVVGTGVLHLRVRDCSPNEEKCLSVTRYKEFEAPGMETSHTQQFRFVDLPAKFTYAKCRKPDDWERRYKLSTQPMSIPPQFFDPDGNIPMTAEHDSIIQSHGFSHNGCVHEIIRDFGSVDYRAGCCVMHRDTLKGSGCISCEAKYQRLVRTFGPPQQGLKGFHADSGVDVSFLQTCRQIYKEAWHLPYESYTFDIPEPLTTTLEDFATRMLYPHQSRLVTSLHTSGVSASDWLEDLERMLKCFPALKRLQISLSPGDCLIDHDGRRERFSQIHALESVEVIVGYDRDEYDTRRNERQRAEVSENLLLGRA